MTNAAIFSRLQAWDHGIYLSSLIGFGLFAALLVWALIVALRVRVWRAPPPSLRHLTAWAMLLTISFSWCIALPELERTVVLDRYEAFLASGVVRVSVDGAQVSDPRPLVRALTHLFDGHPEDSVPTTPYEVIVETRAGTLHLILRPDSKDPSNVWVYDPVLSLTRKNAIGHARSKYFTL